MQLRTILPATSRTVRIAAGGTALAAVLGGTAAFTVLDKDVTLDADGSRTELSVFGGTVADVLESEGVEVGPHDIVAPAVDTAVADGTDIVVRYGRQLTLTVDGEQQVRWTTARTVDEALADLGVRADGAQLSASRSQPLGRSGLVLDVVTPKSAVVVADGQERAVTTTAADVAALLAETGVTVREGDEVSVDTAARVTPEMRVQVVRVDRSQSTEQVAIPHGSRTEETDALYEGERKVVTEGVDGSKTVTFDDVFRDGVRVAHDAVGETVDAQPVERVVQVGTKQKPQPAPAPAAASSSASSSGGGSVGGGVDSLNWSALAACESGGNPSIVSATGKYHGLYQFSVATWRSVGGSGLPSQASAAEQTYRAKLLYQRSGAGQWPTCGKRL
ncbi:ubiquitin-like domain-containing protein [Kineococcus sp. TRM81007]|uniref:resuscitation-promoting factor n=1 Tax=Kineococcus sp. TRM81007 TaxID=2925831 RepID=UPI001F5AEDCD|nr:resuscitation-promoting factor [Kineococcus sp. TRM81007]MCI2238433.1 ubiquitin-like domain-containing protein [Kineococcus sp. TRM81007]